MLGEFLTLCYACAAFSSTFNPSHPASLAPPNEQLSLLKKKVLSLTKLPAILGANPAFGQIIATAKPLLPDIQDVAAEFETILRNGILSKGQHGASLECHAADALEVSHAVADSRRTAG